LGLEFCFPFLGVLGRSFSCLTFSILATRFWSRFGQSFEVLFMGVQYWFGAWSMLWGPIQGQAAIGPFSIGCMMVFLCRVPSVSGLPKDCMPLWRGPSSH
jgi:hypothetical protein